MDGSGNGKLRGKQLFVCRINFAAFVPVEAVVPEEDFDGYARKATTEGTSQEGNNIPMGQMCKEFLNFLSVFFVCVSCYLNESSNFTFKTNNF